MLYIEKLIINSVRNLTESTIEPTKRLNFFFGPNASGKTSILESIYLLSKLKSFRSKRINEVVCKGERKLQVSAKGKKQGMPFSTGMEKGHGITVIKYNGSIVQTASEQVHHLPVYIMTPDHHVLFTGSPKARRHWLDWSLFHVEQNYITIWKSYYRALRHRNALLKTEQNTASLELLGWEKQMAEEAIKIDRLRETYIKQLNQLLNQKFLPIVLIGTAEINYLNQAYKTTGLSELLRVNRKEDIKRGYTSIGPHSVDLTFAHNDFNVGKYLSRGQMKLFGAALLSAQNSLLKTLNVDSLILVDDLDAELDETSSRKLLELLYQNNTQTFVSSLSRPNYSMNEGELSGLFHVEHGKVKKVLE